MIELRSLTDRGIDVFAAYLQNVKRDPSLPPPNLNSEPESVKFNDLKIDETRRFTSRMELGKYLHSIFEKLGLKRADVIRQKGLWTWMAYILFDLITDSRKKIKSHPSYIYFPDNYRYYYRHLVAGAYLLYDLHRENSRLLLATPPYVHSELAEQLAARQELLTSKRMIEVANHLYWDEKRKRPKAGAGGKGPGSPRRLADVFNQLKLTYDLPSMTVEDILDLLPPEFDRWKKR